MADLKGQEMKGEVTTAQGNTGDHSGTTLKTLDKGAIEDPKLISSVEDRLANLNDITKEPRKRSAEPEDDQDKSTPEDRDDQQADDQDKSKDTTPDDKGGDTDVGKEELPSAYLRAAIHRGWKEEDANEFFESNPEAALKTFQNCYLDINNASREWALLGKAKVERDKVLNAPETKSEPELTKVDVEKLQKDYDLDPNTVALLEAQNRQVDEIITSRKQQPVTQQVPVQQQVPVGPNPNIELDLNNFFQADTMKAYSEFYGDLKLGQNWNDLSSGQCNNRWQVIEQAELIISGAESMNHRIDPLDALDRAHMIVSEPIREQVYRDQIKSTAVKRQNSMTLKPSDGSRSTEKVESDTGGNKPRDRKELIASVGQKLQSLNW
jgi:hypothetical protein